MKALTNGLIIALMLDAGWIALGIAGGRNMWAWIVGYWVILTAKNAVDYCRARMEAKPPWE